MKPADIIPTAQKIDKLVSRIDLGEIKIPAFQRGYVWKHGQVIELLDSIVSSYPIGSILLWNTKEKMKSTRNIAGYKIPCRSDQYPVDYALDGQQRLATMYGVFSESIDQENDDHGYNPEKDIFEVYYDFKNKRFVHGFECDVNSDYVVYIRNIIAPKRLMNEMKKLDPIYHDDAQDLMSKFINYEVPVVTITGKEKSDVGVIFERINNTGTRLTALDLMTAWTWTDDFHFLNECRELLDSLGSKGFGSIKKSTLLQIASAIIKDTTRTQETVVLSGDEVRTRWGDIKKAIKASVDYLHTELKCKHLDFLPFTQQLICISKFFYEIKKPSAEQYAAIKRWFWATSFSRRYSSGQTTSKSDADIREVLKLKRGDVEAFNGYEHEISVSSLKGSRFMKSSPMTRAFLLLLGQNNPMDLVSGNRVDVVKSLSKYNLKEYHHVFPKAFLDKVGSENSKIDNRFSNCILNYCFLPSSSNKIISDKAPSNYFFEIIPQAKFESILRSNFLPELKSTYRKDDFNGFLISRAELIIDRVEELIKD